MAARVGLAMKPFRASRMEGAITSARLFVPYFSTASASPATVPGTATAAWPLEGTFPG